MGVKTNRQKRWSLAQQAKILKQVSKLLEKGYTLSQALSFLTFQVSNKEKTDIEKCLEQLKRGESLHDAFVKLQFHRDILSYLYFAEQHGNLQFALKESSSMIEEKVRHRKKFQKLVQYPVLLLLFILSILFVLSTVLLPQFEALYLSFGNKQSSFILLFMQAMSFFPFVLPAVISMPIILYLFYVIYIKKLPPVVQMQLFMRVPVIRTFTRLFNSYFFSVHMSNLLNGGLSIYECFALFQKQEHHPFFQVEAFAFTDQLSSGMRLDHIVSGKSHYEKDLVHVIVHGQQNGELSQELYDYSLFMMERMEQFIFRILKYVQPLTFLFIGIVILLMYMSVMLPMLEVMSSL
ncbi:competence type IV pilus assembly protein ComGB [Priestia megaterium]|uniref:competence type IV pilus assembly protein ComGB n=2 Tax=Priestia megaterium TaxID=1404 RepID=UPI000BF6D952|nr:competence type IV pilus assembly protein ComGB [Priestia megaterium]PFJ99761.1 competence protein ComG [Priestia megaterium]PMD09099.1 competence protein ComG [Priestia megaterium]